MGQIKNEGPKSTITVTALASSKTVGGKRTLVFEEAVDLTPKSPSPLVLSVSVSDLVRYHLASQEGLVLSHFFSFVPC
jgi:hypothetical protein